MRRIAALRVGGLGIAGLLATVGGCAGPGLFGPQGPMELQQREGSVWDPYPDPDWGPEVEGARPRSYQRPFPEPIRSRWTRWNEAFDGQ